MIPSQHKKQGSLALYKILHIADVHLETSFATSRIPASAGSWRRADLRATLGRVLSVARDQQVDLITIAGDLYDQSYALPELADFLAQQFERVAPIPVVIAPGECDPYTSESLYALGNWPANVRIFSQGTLSAIELVPGIRLWGAACPPSRSGQALDTEAVHTQQGVNLLLLHAAEQAITDTRVFAVDAEVVARKGFDFALLGHCHRMRIWPEGNPCCVHPGSPEPLSPEEAGSDHHAVLVTIQDGACSAQPILDCQWQYLTREVDLSNCVSAEDAARGVQNTLRDACGANEKRSVCRLILRGHLQFDLDVAELAALADAKAIVLYEPRLDMPYELNQLSLEQTIRGLLVRRFQKRLEETEASDDRTRTESALLCALRALDGREVGLDEIR